jgi:hypothetical protein
MKCPKCQFENPDDAKFCVECASPMEFHCPNCGAVTPATGKFCKECAFDLKAVQKNLLSIIPNPNHTPLNTLKTKF